MAAAAAAAQDDYAADNMLRYAVIDFSVVPS